MSSLSIRIILEKHVLTGPNFPDWIRNVRLVLRQEKLEYVLDTPIPEIPKDAAALEAFDKKAYDTFLGDANNVQTIMLAAMSMELQRQHFEMKPKEMLDHLKGLFDNESKSLEFDILRELIKSRLHDGGDVSKHVVDMINLIERLEGLNIKFQTRVAVMFILQSLPDSYNTSIVNYKIGRASCRERVYVLV